MIVVRGLLGSYAVERSFVVSLRHKSVDVLDELVNALTVVCCELFDVVMASTVDVVGWVFVPGLLVQLLSVVEGHDLISFPVDDVDWAIDVRHAIDVRELVKGQRPAKVENNAKGGHEARVQNDTSYWVLLSEVA